MFVTALLAASLAAPVPKEKESPYYLPVVEGAKRVSEFSRDGKAVSEATETVTEVETKDGTHTVTLSAEAASGSRLTTVYVVTADGLFSKRGGAADPAPVVKSGAKAGDTWAVERPGIGRRPAVVTTYTVGKEEEVEVPAGKFTALPVTSEPAGGAKETIWYARGVGVVKREGESGGRATRTVLKEFTPGKAKDEKKDDKEGTR